MDGPSRRKRRPCPSRASSASCPADCPGTTVRIPGRHAGVRTAGVTGAVSANRTARGNLRPCFLKTSDRLDSFLKPRGRARCRLRSRRAPPIATASLPIRERSRHERSPRGVPQQDGPSRSGLGAAVPEFEEGVPHRQPGRSQGAVQGGLARRDALVAGRRGQRRRLRLRHLRAVHRPGRAHRCPPGPRAPARRVDRGARRHRAARRGVLRLRPAAPGRPEDRAAALCPPACAAPGEARRQRHPDALREAGRRDPRDGVHRDPRELHARCVPGGGPAAPTSGHGVRSEPSRGGHAGVRARREWRRAARSSRPTSTTRKANRWSSAATSS